MFIKQISVFLENAPGKLCELTELLGRANIDMKALCIADTQNYGIIRIIIRDERIDDALAVVRGAGYIAKVNNVICVRVEDRPMGLHSILKIVEDLGLSVEYMYSLFRPSSEKALLVMRLSEQDESIKKLIEIGVDICSQEEVDKV